MIGYFPLQLERVVSTPAGIGGGSSTSERLEATVRALTMCKAQLTKAYSFFFGTRLDGRAPAARARLPRTGARPLSCANCGAEDNDTHTAVQEEEP